MHNYLERHQPLDRTLGRIAHEVLDEPEQRQRFEELLGVTINICLADPAAYHERRAAWRADMAERRARPEAKLLARLGLRGLRYSYETFYHGEAVLTQSRLREELGAQDGFKSAESNPVELTTMDTAITHPEDFAYPPDPEVTADLELLGKLYLHQLYQHLSPPLQHWTERLKAAQNDAEQFDALAALYNIIATAKNNSRTANKDDVMNKSIRGQDGREFYHPLRLSINLLKNYPESVAQPTCLGASLVLAACVEQSGLDYVHAGTLEDKLTSARIEQLSIFQYIPNAARRYGIELSPLMEERLEAAKTELGTMILEDNGFHGLIMVRMTTDGWLELDPNMNVFAYSSRQKAVVDKYHDLTLLNSYGLPIEISTNERRRFREGLGVIMGLAWMVYDQAPSLEELDDFLAQCPASTAPSDLIVKIFGDYFTEDDLFLMYGEVMSGEVGPQWLFDTARAVLMQSVFPDAEQTGDLTAALERCHQDSRYRRRRAEDLRCLPLMLGLRLVSLSASTTIKGQKLEEPHGALEIGLPYHRIGAALVSNVAALFPDLRASADWWLSQWSSQEALISNLPDVGADLGERALQMIRHNIAATQDTRHLTHQKKSDIVREFSRTHPGAVSVENEGEADDAARTSG